MQLLRLMNRWQIHRQELERVLISLPRVCRFVIIKQDTYVIQVRGSTERRVTKVQLKGLFGKTLNIDMKIAVVTQLEIYNEVNLSSIPSKFYIQHSLVLLLCGGRPKGSQYWRNYNKDHKLVSHCQWYLHLLYIVKQYKSCFSLILDTQILILARVQYITTKDKPAGCNSRKNLLSLLPINILYQTKEVFSFCA